ncbi:MAG: HNH endonuclease [Muribaculaceae bacterium]|jgi:5-methylcytosine-specific restriction enzyme A|nr:HNH endonuclease [Muribaculaceae bacterium]
MERETILYNKYILKKDVDWSLLRNGMTIPINLYTTIFDAIGFNVERGDSREIKVMIDDIPYNLKLENINFDKSKYPNHKDLLQIRYSKTSPFAIKLQSIFRQEYEYIQFKKQQSEIRKAITIPDDLKGYVTLSTTQIQGVFILDCFQKGFFDDAKLYLKNIPEIDFETDPDFILDDKTASIVLKEKLMKTRKLDKAVIDGLKKLYDFRCQITGEKIGEKYGGMVVEAHHIEPFTKSLNNNASNIVIINPSFHRIIHKMEPRFDRESLSFIFANGVIETIKIDNHLRAINPFI